MYYLSEEVGGSGKGLVWVKLNKDTDVFAAKEATLLADVQRVSMDLEQAKMNHQPTLRGLPAMLNTLREELLLVKAEHYVNTKDLEDTRDEMVVLVINWKVVRQSWLLRSLPLLK